MMLIHSKSFQQSGHMNGDLGIEYGHHINIIYRKSMHKNKPDLVN